MRKLTSRSLAFVGLTAALGYGGELGSYGLHSRPSIYPLPKGAHQNAESLAKAAAKRDRKAAKRKGSMG